MNDPAAEAASRAWDKNRINDFEFDPYLMGAREALAPILELHLISTHPGICQECHHDWPCATAKLAYREAEL